MSYEVLARKWRPRSFPELVGQDHVRRALVNALDHDRMHHAYLFTGTRGVGKTTIARILAKSLNCETNGVSSEPCGTCSACTEIDEGRFVDLIEVDAASRTKVDETRELLDNVPYAPSRGRYKVYLIDEVHMFSNHSFNALLKTLEEPPPHVRFLLATTDPQKVPVTVLSRCLQFNLRLMPVAAITEHLERILAAEGVDFEAAALGQIARSASGSMRDALSLLDQAIAFGEGSVRAADVEGMLGTLSRERLFSLVEALADADSARLMREIDELARAASDLEPVLADLLSLLHQLAIAQTVPDAVDESVADVERVRDLAARVSPEDVQLYYQIGTLGRRELPWAPDPRSGLEMTLLRMLAFRPAGVDEPAAGVAPASSEPAPRPAASSPGAGPHSAPGGDTVDSTAGATQSGGPAPVRSAREAMARAREQTAAAEAASPTTPGPAAATAEQAPEARAAAPADSAPAESSPAESSPAGPASPDAASPEPASTAGTARASADPVGDWEGTVRALELRGLAGELAANSAPLDWSEGRLRLALAGEHAHLGGERYRQRLEEALGERLGQRVRIELVNDTAERGETPAEAERRRVDARHAEAEQAIQGDPVVQAFQEHFGAEVEQGSVRPAADSGSADGNH
jgi:DNA polymerase-3 subunit gamma/tau